MWAGAAVALLPLLGGLLVLWGKGRETALVDRAVRAVRSVDTALSARIRRAARLVEDLAKAPSGESVELSRLHLDEVLAGVSLVDIEHSARRRGRKLRWFALGLLALVVLLTFGRVLSIVEGLDVLVARRGVAPFAISYIEESDIEAELPLHVAGANRKVPVYYEQIVLPAGAEITWRMIPRVSERTFVVTDGLRDVPFVSDGHGAWVAKIRVDDPSELRVAATFGDVKVLHTERLRVSTIPDRAPTVTLVDGPREVKISELDRLPIEFVAQDDYGLSVVELVIQSGEHEERQELVRLDGNRRVYRGATAVTRKTSLVEGAYQPVIVTVQARDGDLVTGPRWGKSEAIVLLPEPIGEDLAERHLALRAFRRALVEYRVDFERANGGPSAARTGRARGGTGPAGAFAGGTPTAFANFGDPSAWIARVSSSPGRKSRRSSSTGDATGGSPLGDGRALVRTFAGGRQALVERPGRRGRRAGRASSCIADERGRANSREIAGRPRGSETGCTAPGRGWDEWTRFGAGSSGRFGARAPFARDFGTFARGGSAPAPSRAPSARHSVLRGQRRGRRVRRAFWVRRVRSAALSCALRVRPTERTGLLPRRAARPRAERARTTARRRCPCGEADARKDEGLWRLAKELRDTLEALPNFGRVPGSALAEASQARSQGEAMADALDAGQLDRSLESGRAALEALERAQRSNDAQGGYLPREDLERARDALERARAAAAQAKRQKPQLSLGERAERQRELGRAAQELADEAAQGPAPLPEGVRGALRRAGELMQKAGEALERGDAARGRELSTEAQEELLRALPERRQDDAQPAEGESEAGDPSHVREGHADVPGQSEDRSRAFRERVEAGLGRESGRFGPAVRRYAETLK